MIHWLQRNNAEKHAGKRKISRTMPDWLANCGLFLLAPGGIGHLCPCFTHALVLPWQQGRCRNRLTSTIDTNRHSIFRFSTLHRARRPTYHEFLSYRVMLEQTLGSSRRLHQGMDPGTRKHNPLKVRVVPGFAPEPSLNPVVINTFPCILCAFLGFTFTMLFYYCCVDTQKVTSPPREGRATGAMKQSKHFSSAQEVS